MRLQEQTEFNRLQGDLDRAEAQYDRAHDALDSAPADDAPTAETVVNQRLPVLDEPEAAAPGARLRKAGHDADPVRRPRRDAVAGPRRRRRHARPHDPRAERHHGTFGVDVLAVVPDTAR